MNECMYVCMYSMYADQSHLGTSLLLCCPCSMSEWEAPPRRTQSYPPNLYTQAYVGTCQQWRKRLYMGRSNSAPSAGAGRRTWIEGMVLFERHAAPRMDPGRAWIEGMVLFERQDGTNVRREIHQPQRGPSSTRML